VTATDDAPLELGEHTRVLRARQRQSTSTRWAFALCAFAAAAADLLLDTAAAPWQLILAFPVIIGIANALAVRALRTERFGEAEARALLVADSVGLASIALLGGSNGYVALPGYIMVVAGQALGLPGTARSQLVLLTVLHPAARIASALWLDFELQPMQLAVEIVCLAAVGWVATVAPAVNTRRLRRARVALAALARGEFGVRLPERSEDDLGLLAVSFNQMAESVGRSVTALESEVAEHESAKVALRESEARLWIAQSEAQGTAARMRAVANAASGVLAAESLARLVEVLRDACRQVIPFDAFALSLHDARESRWEAIEGSDPHLVEERIGNLVLERRAALRMSARVARDGQRESGSVLLAPLIASEGLLGVLALRRDVDAGYTGADVEVSEVLAHLAATAVRNVTLVDELRRSREAFAHQAFHDPLTGLANRARLRERLSRALSGPNRDGMALLVLDLDGFKRVNDSLGHASGDHLLREVSKRLLHATRGADLVSRLGGDEFAILLETARAEVDATIVAERVLNALRVPFTLGSAEAVVGTSIGIARPQRRRDGVVAGSSEDVETSIEAVMRDADLAMYRAKAAGKGRFAFFEPSMHAEAVERLALEADLRTALGRGEFSLAYQPIIGLQDGEAVGFEALLRWNHPTRGLMMPADFVPVAEETGLICAIGAWVMREACGCMVHWNAARARASLPALTVTVNVSARQVYEPGFVDEVMGVLRASGLEPSHLLLEITESVMLDRPEVARERFVALKDAGVRLAVDDFGTGYSALSYLQAFPIDTLKIDKSFVSGLRRGGSQAALARTIVALGRALGLRTIAEGIESDDQRVALRDAGCAYGQGFLFAPPLSPADAEVLLMASAPVTITARVVSAA
jgi:diguanylate cyclase (GGDEF)-like protein